MKQKHRTTCGILIYGCFIPLLCAGIFCCIAGCMTGTATTIGGTDKTFTTSVVTTDVIIPLSSISEITYTSSMQKRSVPYGVYEGLVIKDRFGQFIPSLARNWDVSADAKTWTFHLAENAQWNDGVSFTCRDVKFTNDYLKANNLTMGYVWKDVQSIACPDDHTAVFSLKSSYSGFLDQVSRQPGIMISARHIWENVTDPQHYTDTAFVGTGPFIFVKSEPGYVLLKTNKVYYGKVPAVSGLVFKLITNADSRVLALKNGEIDVVSDISPAVAQSLAGEKDISIYTISDTSSYEVAFNMARYPSNISAFRQAMSHSVDRNIISSLFGTGRPTETTFLIPDLAGDYVNPDDVGMYDYNLTKAQEMLASAGFNKNADGMLIGPDGKPVSVTIPYTSSKGSSGHDKVLAVLKNDWGKLGIAVTTLSYEDQTQYRNAVSQYPVFIDAFPVTLHDDADALVNFAVTPTQESNYYSYNNAEYNSLVTQIQNTPDRAEIMRLAYRMQDILAEDIPTIPVCTTDTIVAYRNDRFTGWDIGPGYHSITDPLVLVNLTSVQGS